MTEVDDGSSVAEVLRDQGIPLVFAPMEPRDAELRRRLETSGVAVVETLHDQTAAFAAEAWAKVTRQSGVLVLDGPAGIPRAMTAIANAYANGSPVVFVSDQRASSRGGGGFVDHTAMTRTVTRSSWAVGEDEFPQALGQACGVSNRPPRGPVLLQIDGSHQVRDAMSLPADGPVASEHGTQAVEDIAALLNQAERPVVLAGGGVYWSKAEAALRRFAETVGVPVVMNGMGRGTLAPDHELALSRARPTALREADLVLVAGTPLDFRLGYGRFGAARVAHLCEHAAEIATHAELASAAVGDLALLFEALTNKAGGATRSAGWTARLREEEAQRRAAEESGFSADETPMRPPRLYGELRRWLARDAIVIGDGGDFISYAGRFVDTFTPGCFLDPGPYGCLGIGMGYAIGARIAHPRRQVVVLLGDGAAGFSLMEFETLVRYGLPVVVIVGNNNGWGLEKHHMDAMFGYDVVADLAPGTRYDTVATSLGGHGEIVAEPADLAQALERAFAFSGPALVNVMLDPADTYPRSTILA